MSVHEDLVSEVMNDAISFLESAEIPVTPKTHHDMLHAWYESFEGRRDDHAYKMREVIHIAMTRLILHIAVPTV
jgi:hypothetical protein